jgi:hypothetical protein
MNLASKVVCAITCLSTLGCGDDAASDREAFVDYWADSSAYCGKVADECKQTSRAACEADWPEAAEIERAIEQAKLDANALARCESAGHAEDACYAKVACAALTAEEVPCETENQRVQLDCASLLAALDHPVTSDTGDGNTSNGQPSATGENVGKELCDRAAECATEPINAADLATCIDQVNQSFSSILPDPHAAAECIKRADCTSLQEQGESVTRDCIDVDPDATRCIDAETLHICNGDGTCRNVKCAETCKALSATAVGCGLNETDGYDKCQCALE